MPADPATAFDVFTSNIGHWWPVAGHSVHGAGSTVEFAAGRLIERSAAGETSIWGSVTRWEPPAAVAFTWHPGRPTDQAGRVEITFAAAAAGQTLVRLEHSGWDHFTDPAAVWAEYEEGWPVVLGGFQSAVTARAAAPA